MNMKIFSLVGARVEAQRLNVAVLGAARDGEQFPGNVELKTYRRVLEVQDESAGIIRFQNTHVWGPALVRPGVNRGGEFIETRGWVQKGVVSSEVDGKVVGLRNTQEAVSQQEVIGDRVRALKPCRRALKQGRELLEVEDDA